MAEPAIIEALLTRDALQSRDVESRVQSAAAGAVVSFQGTTRNQHLGRGVLYLEYEAHPVLAQKMMLQLCSKAAGKFNLLAAVMHHRSGRIEIGEYSVIIAVSSAHRSAAFDGCRYIIDALKTTVPIWKKEHYTDGSAPQWVGPDGKPLSL